MTFPLKRRQKKEKVFQRNKEVILLLTHVINIHLKKNLNREFFPSYSPINIS